MFVLKKPLVCFLLYFLIETLADFYPKSSGIINADASNFDSVVAVNENEVYMVEFYAPWCGHCKQLQPEYVKLAKSLKNIVKIVAMDANDEKNRGIAQRYGVQGFPTLKVHIGTSSAIDYQGARDANSMKQFLLDKLPNFTQRVSLKNLDKFHSKNLDMPRALVFSKKKIVSPTVKRFSALLNGHIVIGDVSTKDATDIAKKYGIAIDKDSSNIFMFKPNSTETPDLFQGNTKSFREVKSWLYSYAPGLEDDDDQSLPKLLDHSCYKQKCENKGLCVILIKGEDENDYQKAHSILQEIEEKSSDSSLFAFSQIIASEGNNFEWIQGLFGNIDTYYSNIIVFAPIKKRYAHYVGSIAYEPIKGFIIGILSGKTRTTPIATKEIPMLSTDTEYCKPPKPKPKSKPKPKPTEKQQKSSKSGPGYGSPFLIQLNKDNFQQVVYGNNQPVVIEFYAPWCGHCQQFAPEYAKAATNMKGMVLFATIDCDNNDNKPICGQFQIKGFPTVKIFGVGRDKKMKNGPMDYNGQRNSKSLETAAINTLYSIKIPILGTVEEYNEYLNNKQPDFKLLLLSDKKKPPTLLRALAAAFDTVSFSMITSSNKVLIDTLNIDTTSSDKKYPIIFGFKKNSIDPIEYNKKDYKFIQISQWIVEFLQESQKSKTEL